MRWWTLRTAAALQGLYAAILVALSIYCFFLAHAAAGSGKTRHAAGLYVGGWTIAVLGIISAVGAFELWQYRKWAWWLCLVANIVPALLILVESIVSGDDDPDNWSAIVFFLIPTVVLLLTRVRGKSA